MVHNKGDIVKAYRDYCETVLSDDTFDIDKIKETCSKCIFGDWCKRNSNNVMGASDEEYEWMENMLVKKGFLMSEEDRNKVLDTLTMYCDTITEDSCDMGICIFRDFCERNFFVNKASDKDFQEVKKRLQSLGWIEGTKEIKDSTSVVIEKDFGEEDFNEPEKTSSSYESVNGPSHYNGTDCIENMRKLYGDEAVKYFCLCNAYKYNYRAGKKPGSSMDEDVKKSQWYYDYLVKIIQEISKGE